MVQWDSKRRKVTGMPTKTDPFYIGRAALLQVFRGELYICVCLLMPDHREFRMTQGEVFLDCVWILNRSNWRLIRLISQLMFQQAGKADQIQASLRTYSGPIKYLDMEAALKNAWMSSHNIIKSNHASYFLKKYSVTQFSSKAFQKEKFVGFKMKTVIVIMLKMYSF